MKIDTYTKIILTIIAVCLVCLVINKPLDSGILVSSANAQDYSAPKVIDVNIVSIDGKRFSPMAVSPLGAALPVQINTK